MSKKASSISMKKEKKKTNIPHNNREMDEKEWKRNDHIDRSRIDENIMLKNEDIEELYEREFGEPLKKYNAKQRRKDRKIDNYYEHVKNSKKTHEQQEMIIQVGDMDNIQLGELDPDEARDILLEWYEGFEERNPNLKVYNAVIHMDEATPHMHLNFVPVASGYKRGLEKQVSFDRAILQADDSLDKKRPYKDWRDKEVGLIADIMKKRGYSRKLVGTHESMTVDRYKEVRERERKAERTENRYKVREMMNKSREQQNELERQKNDDRALELDNLSNNLKKQQTALNTSKNDFESYKEQEHKKIQEQKQQNELERQKNDDRALELDNLSNNLKKQQTALNTSKNDFESYKEQEYEKLTDRENDVHKKEQEIKRKAEEMKLERLKLAEMMKKAHTWTIDKLEDMKNHLQKRRRQIELSDDDLMDLNEDDQIKL